MAMGKLQPGCKNGRPRLRPNASEVSARLRVCKRFVFYIFQLKAGVRKTLSYIKVTSEREGPRRWAGAQSRNPLLRRGPRVGSSHFQERSSDGVNPAR
jgi:hypothetical protein